MKRYALIFLAAIFVPSLILGWLALRTAGEQRVLIERQAADLHQAETDALAAEMRALIEEKQHAFDEIVRALISKQDAAALAGDYGNQLFSAWHEGGIPFAISPEGILVFPTPAHAVTNPAFEEFLWYNSAFLSNNTVEEVFQTQQTSSFKGNSPHEKEAGRTARAATIPIATNPPSDKADTRLQKERSPPRSIVPLRGTPDTQSSAFSRVAPEFSNFRMAVEGAANGVLSRFVQNDLQLFFWTHPDPNEGWLFGLVLGPGELSRLASGILPKRSGNTTWVAILNDKAKPVSKSPAEFAAKWKRPFVATEIGEFLPHWEVALYLANPAQFRESARLVTITVILLIALALAAILAGGYLVALDTRRQLAIAQQKTDFVSNVSHELKTPLTSIRMFAELLAEDRVKEPEKRSRYLRIIVSESERLARLVNNVLDFARIERKRKSYDMRPADARPVIERIWEAECDRLREAGFAVEWTSDKGPYPVVCDQDALAQILVNLISNAEKYSPDKKEITLSSRLEGDMLSIAVLDRGSSVAKGIEKRIFEAFFRGSDSLSSSVQGSGLGLTLARRMARDQGGDVTFQRREGGGSIFTLRITSATNANLMTKRILIVEDDPHIRIGLVEALESKGFQVAECRDGRHAIPAVQERKPDLVILDIMLPHKSGYDICRELREAGNSVLILMLTAKGNEADKVIGLDLGADDYVTKPFGVRELIARVHALLRRGQRGKSENELSERLDFGDVQIDVPALRGLRNGIAFELTPRELSVLTLLYRERGHAVSRDRIFSEIWGMEYYGTTRTLDQVIVKLRQKIESEPSEPRHLLTVHGLGYRLDP